MGILWKDRQEAMYLWVDQIQHYRNAVHSFNYRDIGSAVEYMEDMDVFYEYVEDTLRHLPPLEDYVPYYPAGYITTPYFD